MAAGDRQNSASPETAPSGLIKPGVPRRPSNALAKIFSCEGLELVRPDQPEPDIQIREARQFARHLLARNLGCEDVQLADCDAIWQHPPTPHGLQGKRTGGGPAHFLRVRRPKRYAGVSTQRL